MQSPIQIKSPPNQDALLTTEICGRLVWFDAKRVPGQPPPIERLRAFTAALEEVSEKAIRGARSGKVSLARRAEVVISLAELMRRHQVKEYLRNSETSRLMEAASDILRWEG